MKERVQRAADDLRKAQVTLSALTPSETPQECIIPREAAIVFERSLAEQGVPYLLFEYDPDTLSDYHPRTSLSEAAAYLSAHLGCDRDGSPIAPAVLCMHYTPESVIAYCEGYVAAAPTDTFWRAFREFSDALDEMDGVS